MYFFNIFVKLLKSKATFTFFHELFQQVIDLQTDNIDLKFFKNGSYVNENVKFLLQMTDWNENKQNTSRCCGEKI